MRRTLSRILHSKNRTLIFNISINIYTCYVANKMRLGTLFVQHRQNVKFYSRSLFNRQLNFSHVKVINKLLKIALMREQVFLAVFTSFCLFCTCDIFTLLCYRGLKRNLFCRKKIKRDFLHGKKNFAKELRDKHCALFQSSPKSNCMLITRLICIRRKSSRFLFPVFMISARNAWDHGRPIGKDRRKKKNACVFRVSLR